MKKYIYLALFATTLCGMAFPAFAGHGSCGDVQITSSQIVDDGGYEYWLVSGSCLEQVTNVALANDFGNGFEELDFYHYDIDGIDSLEIPLVTRTGLGDSLPIGQYLLQVKKCESKKGKEKCSVLDEKYLVAPLLPYNPLPQAGDACTTFQDTVVFDQSDAGLYGCDGSEPQELFCNPGLVWVCENTSGG